MASERWGGGACVSDCLRLGQVSQSKWSITGIKFPPQVTRNVTTAHPLDLRTTDVHLSFFPAPREGLVCPPNPGAMQLWDWWWRQLRCLLSPPWAQTQIQQGLGFIRGRKSSRTVATRGSGWHCNHTLPRSQAPEAPGKDQPQGASRPRPGNTTPMSG